MNRFQDENAPQEGKQSERKGKTSRCGASPMRVSLNWERAACGTDKTVQRQKGSREQLARENQIKLPRGGQRALKGKVEAKRRVKNSKRPLSKPQYYYKATSCLRGGGKTKAGKLEKGKTKRRTIDAVLGGSQQF